jgi:hypothetical protein
MARAMILHACLHWKNGIDSSLWPMAATYAAHVYNHIPKDGICPADICTGSTVPRHRLIDLHVWGCPVYVLDPKIQQGQKLPRWQPRSHCGIFMGLSNQHSSEVPMVLNLKTGSITTHFHVVFDNLFTTVPSVEKENDPPSHCKDLYLDSSTHILADDPPTFLQDDWLTDEEREVKYRCFQRETSIRNAQRQPPEPESSPLITTVPTPDPITLEPVEFGTPDNDVHVDDAPIAFNQVHHEETPPASEISGLRRSTRSTAGKRITPLYHDVFLAQAPMFE